MGISVLSSGEEAQHCPAVPPSVLASVPACLCMAPPPLPPASLGIFPTVWEPPGLAVPCSFHEIPFSESTLTFAPGPAPRPHRFILGCFYSLTKRIWSQDVLGPWLPLELAQASSCGGGCVGWERSGEETRKEPGAPTASLECRRVGAGSPALPPLSQSQSNHLYCLGRNSGPQTNGQWQCWL